MSENRQRPVGFNDQDLSEELKKLTKQLGELDTTLTGTLKELAEESKKVREKAESKNPYADYLEKERKKKDSMTADSSAYTSKFGEQLGQQIFFSDQRKNIENSSNLSRDEKNAALNSLGIQEDQEKQEEVRKGWQQRGKDINDIMSGTLENIILDFDNFDQSMKSMSKQLMNYVLKQSIDSLFKNLGSLGGDKSILSSLAGSAGSGGFWGTTASFLLGMFGVGKKHSGGVVPTAGYSIPGTQEQLAVLKGGERVLSPGENVEYSRGGGGTPPIVYNNFNVKAWDSKDVSKYFLENKDLLNSITFKGIKDNNQNLRYLVQNA